jgi:hypothetical protein
MTLSYSDVLDEKVACDQQNQPSRQFGHTQVPATDHEESCTGNRRQKTLKDLIMQRWHTDTPTVAAHAARAEACHGRQMLSKHKSAHI